MNLYCEEYIDEHDLAPLDGWQEFNDSYACDRCSEELYELTPTVLLVHTETLETEEQYRSVTIGTVIRGEDKLEFSRVTHVWQNLGHSSSQLAHDEMSGLTEEKVID